RRSRQVKTSNGSILPSVVESGGVRESAASAASAARRDAWARRIPLLPAFIYVFLVTQIPFVLTIYYSLFSWNLLKEGSASLFTGHRFVGLDNFATLLTNGGIRTAIATTVILTLCAIPISVVLGLVVAMLLNTEAFGKGLITTRVIATFTMLRKYCA